MWLCCKILGSEECKMESLQLLANPDLLTKNICCDNFSNILLTLLFTILILQKRVFKSATQKLIKCSIRKNFTKNVALPLNIYHNQYIEEDSMVATTIYFYFISLFEYFIIWKL